MTEQPKKSAPIGVFDYGIGGLTVIKELEKAMPNERFLFLADEARVNSPQEESIARQIHTENAIRYASFLQSKGAKMIVIACNLMSVYGAEPLREQLDIPVISLVESTITAFSKEIKHPTEKKVAVFTTDIAAKVQLFTKKLQEIFPGITICEVACPRLAQIIAKGLAGHPEADRQVLEYVKTLDTPVDAALLACTRFPVLLSSFQKALPKIPILDPAKYLSPLVVETLASKGEDQKEKVTEISHFYTTGDALAFKQAGERILGEEVKFTVEHVDFI